MAAAQATRPTLSHLNTNQSQVSSYPVQLIAKVQHSMVSPPLMMQSGSVISSKIKTEMSPVAKVPERSHSIDQMNENIGSLDTSLYDEFFKPALQR
jgi:hypothetical protein